MDNGTASEPRKPEPWRPFGEEVAPPEAPATAQKDEEAGRKTRAKRLLVVEDDGPIRQALAQLLLDEGYDVDSCDSGASALEHLRSGPAPDLIVLDLRMPVMDGWEFRATQRSDPTLASIPVLAVSADGSARARAIHADGYLQKPLRAAELIATIERIIGEAERHQKLAQVAETERLASLGRLAAGVGHEINNPLTYVTLNVKLALERVEAAARAEPGATLELGDFRELLADSLDGLDRISRVVSSLQGLARKSEGEAVSVNLELLLDRALAMVGHEIRPRARVVKSYARLPAIVGNAGTLSQLFVNLLTNAAQAIEEGKAQQNEVAVTTAMHPPHLIVEIVDTGVGIPQEVLPHIFDPFYTTKAPGHGTGLGLSICRQIIDDHRGDIAVESRPGGGTVVRVRFPLALVDLPVPEAPLPPALDTDSARKRILVADDELLIAKVIRRALAPDYDVVCATSSQDALEHITRGERFDLVLCDMIMPVGGGGEMLAGLKSHAPELVSRLVFMTGGAFTPLAEQLIASSQAPVLHKPFAIDDVRRLVAEMFPGHKPAG